MPGTHVPGAQSSAPDDSLLQLWTLVLKNRWETYNKQALVALILWYESHGLDVSEGASPDAKTWEQAGQHILSVASTGQETTINNVKPWRLIRNLLKPLKREQDTRMAEGSPLAPPAEVSGKTMVLGVQMVHKASGRGGQAEKSQCAAELPGISLPPPPDMSPQQSMPQSPRTLPLSQEGIHCWQDASQPNPAVLPLSRTLKLQPATLPLRALPPRVWPGQQRPLSLPPAAVRPCSLSGCTMYGCCRATPAASRCRTPPAAACCPAIAWCACRSMLCLSARTPGTAPSSCQVLNCCQCSRFCGRTMLSSCNKRTSCYRA